MPYCSNCGFKLSEEARFCPQCGQKAIQIEEPETAPPPEESIPVPEKKPYVHKIDRTFTLLDQGDIFHNHFRIEQIIGRDNDGITYLAVDERCGVQRSLKLYHQAYFDNVDKLFGSIVRMSKIKSVIHPHVAKAFEVNQTHRPAYIVSEYIEGKSLATTKERNPEQLTEATVRKFAAQIIDAAITIRKAGLSVRNLNLNNIVLSDQQNVVILSSGINYDVGDEREDIFNIGLLLAKLFATSAFYETIYIPQRYMDKKFEFISGVTNQVNDILTRCLQKNLNQRYSTFENLAEAFQKLKPIKPSDIYVSDETEISPLTNESDIALPKRKTDIYFWIIIIFTIAFIFILMSTNLLDTIFSQDKTPFKFTGFLTEVPDTTLEKASTPDDSYRNIKTNVRLGVFEGNNRTATRTRVNPAIEIPPSDPLAARTPYQQETSPIQNTSPASSKPAMPANFVYISPSTFAFCNLKSDAKPDASLSSFYISKTEVTQAEWNDYMQPADVSLAGNNLPVDNITWYEAVQFCNKRSEGEGLTPCYKISGINVSCNFKANGYRLPTEAEWEYAARAEKPFKYSGSNVANQVAWYKANAKGRIHLVNTKSANPFGIHDMTGNVSEWCWDWYDANYPKTMPYVNPTGPTFGTIKVIRGGNIEDGDNSSLEVIYRYRGTPSRAYPYVGFRLVRDK